MRFLLIDRFTSWQPGKRGSAVKNVTLSEDFFDDHFPLEPIFPGALILEGMAQLSGLLLEEGERAETGKNVKALLTIVGKAKFRRFARPGDCLEYFAEVESANELGGAVNVKARIGDEVVAECHLIFAFQALENPILEARRRQVLQVWLRGLKADAGH